MSGYTDYDAISSPAYVVRCQSCREVADPITRKIAHKKMGPKPDMEDIEEWIWEGIAEATDGCSVEPDGICPHGHRSWLLVYGLI